MNNAELRGAYFAIVSDPGRGEALREALTSATTKQLTELFDAVVADQPAALAELVTAWLKPVAERHICDGMRKRVVFDRKGDNEI